VQELGVLGIEELALERTRRRSSSATTDWAIARSLPRLTLACGSMKSVCPVWLALWTMPGTSPRKLDTTGTTYRPLRSV
jgi:hypothetical protein